jgi:hypothetical protein
MELGLSIQAITLVFLHAMFLRLLFVEFNTRD